jgi:hypothetical protein
MIGLANFLDVMLHHQASTQYFDRRKQHRATVACRLAGWILVRSAGMIIPSPQADSWGGARRPSRSSGRAAA